MFTQLRRFFVINVALIISLAGSAFLLPSVPVQAASAMPAMTVTLEARGSSYSALVYDGVAVTLNATVNNTGNVPLQMVATPDVPQGWGLNDKYDNCSNLAPGEPCTFTWVFTPQGSGQLYLRVYFRGIYTDSSGNLNRITQAPAFLFNVLTSWLPPYVPGTVTNTTTTSGSSTVAPYLYPSMSVVLIANNLYEYSETVYAERVIIFRAVVENTSDVPLQVVANLTIPPGWTESENVYSDCPPNASLGHKDSCTITWKLYPEVSGQVYLRVYVRGYYEDTLGNLNRITQSPAFIFTVMPPKG